MLFVQIIQLFFTVYTLMIFVRIVSSWIPELNRYAIMGYIHLYTEPYLNFFRRIIPPIGMIDLSPMAALIALHFLEKIVLSILFL